MKRFGEILLKNFRYVFGSSAKAILRILKKIFSAILKILIEYALIAGGAALALLAIKVIMSTLHETHPVIAVVASVFATILVIMLDIVFGLSVRDMRIELAEKRELEAGEN